MAAPTLIRGTLRSLLAPKRLLPIIVVSLPLIAAQRAFSHDPWAVPIGVAMCLLFLGIAPVSYRMLFAEPLPLRHAFVALILYGAIGSGVVLSIGAVIPKLLGMGRTFLTDRHSLMICAALFVVGGWGLGRDIGLEASLEREKKRADALRREAEHAQLLALRSHLDPHFLFNTLNAIAEWCREDGEIAERAVLELSAMLRTILPAIRERSWALSEELRLIRTLFELHLLRDPSRFTFEIHADQTLDAIQVPPMLLLPLAENAVKHGPGAGHKGHIALRISAEKNQLVVSLDNPGPYKGPRVGSSGVPTVERRIHLAYGDAGQLKLAAAAPDRTLAQVVLPLSGPLHGALT